MSGDSALLFEKKIAELKRQICVAESELAAVRSLLNTERFELRRTISTQVTSENELEQKAWEFFSRIPDVSVESSFYAAESWIAERDRRRKESDK